MLSFVHCLTVYIFLIYFIVDTQQTLESYITLTDKDTIFTPKNSLELPLNKVYVSLLVNCAIQCNRNIFCRTFIYDHITHYCQLYQSDVSNGDITTSASPSSQVGFIKYEKNLYSDYNQTCDYCQSSRYLACQNATCQCPSPITYWDGQMCKNKLLYGDACNSSTQCQQDLNFTCIFGSCQSSLSMCKLGATVMTFDDIPGKFPTEGNIPSTYNGLSWMNGHYLNLSSGFVGSGYPFALSSGEYLGFFGPDMTIQTLTVNNTITLNSFVVAVAWSDPINLTIAGYYFSTQLHTYTISLNTYTQYIIELNWSGLNKIIFSTVGPGYLDVGMDNLCITF